jgi:hypothetical protein
MPFKSLYKPVFDMVKDAANLLKVKVVQVGEEAFTGSIISHIRSGIEAADMVLAIVITPPQSGGLDGCEQP